MQGSGHSVCKPLIRTLQPILVPRRPLFFSLLERIYHSWSIVWVELLVEFSRFTCFNIYLVRMLKSLLRIPLQWWNSAFNRLWSIHHLNAQAPLIEYSHRVVLNEFPLRDVLASGRSCTIPWRCRKERCDKLLKSISIRTTYFFGSSGSRSEVNTIQKSWQNIEAEL